MRFSGKASELIERLQELIGEHGDLPVKSLIYGSSIDMIEWYDKDGDDKSDAVEFCL